MVTYGGHTVILKNLLNLMKKIKVAKETYTDPNVGIRTANGEYIPGIPVAYSPNIFEAVRHALGTHFSFGQPFCVVCLKKEATQQ